MTWEFGDVGLSVRASVALVTAVLGATALFGCGDDGGGGDGSGGSDGFSLPGTGAASSGTGASATGSGSGTGVGSGGEYEAELQHCVDVINGYRVEHGQSTLTRSAELEACATAGAQEDAQSGSPHGHFKSTGGCNGTTDAENEIPGWPLSSYGSVTAVIDGGAQLMMDEGPGGGHYENILGDHTAVGCGIFVTASEEVWIVHDFK